MEEREFYLNISKKESYSFRELDRQISSGLFERIMIGNAKLSPLVRENPSISVLLCKDKDTEVVEYALSRYLSPTMVSEYQTQLPDKKILQRKLHELFEK